MTIPKDVKDIARHVMAGAFGKPIHEGVDAIAKAILAERKRCADVARKHKLPGHTVGNEWREMIGPEIAHAIEAGQ
jgi:hypothetical protein